MLLFFLFILTIPFSVLFHEMGHALAALFTTKQKVTVFLGSYGNIENGFRFSIGLLTFYFTYNPFLWWRGLCKPASLRMSVNQRIIIIAGGPFASFLLTLSAGWLAITYFRDDIIGLFSVEVLAVTASYFFVNIVPSSRKYKLHNGVTFENDGKQIIRLLKQRKFPPNYIHALAHYNEKKFTEASALLDDIVMTQTYGHEVWSAMLSIHLSAKEYEKALLVHEFLKAYFTLNSNDYSDLGLLKARLGLQQESLIAMDKSLSLSPQNFYALNNKGLFLTEWGNYEEAIPYLDRAISINSKSAPIFTSRAQAKLKTGDIENGLADIYRSLEIDPNNANTYVLLGTYCLETGNKKEALENFIKAKNLGDHSVNINELIKMASVKNGEGQ